MTDLLTTPIPLTYGDLLFAIVIFLVFSFFRGFIRQLLVHLRGEQTDAPNDRR